MDILNKILYTARATTVGGRNGHVASESGRLEFDLSKPAAAGGPGGDKTNPEELFACGYSACFGGAIEYVAGTRKLEIESPEVQAEVNFGLIEGGVALSVNLNARIKGVSDEVAMELMNEAHEKVCPYSKATRGNVEVTLNLMK